MARQISLLQLLRDKKHLFSGNDITRHEQQLLTAAEALLANYRRDPKGERAQDSLFYLGQALMKLGQPGQACKAYAELEEVYAGNVRAPIKSALTGAKADAKCG